MVDLPEDVLFLIFQVLAAPASSHFVYLQRQEALCRLCLVSRRMDALVRPLLWRQVWLRGPDAVRDFRAQGPHMLGPQTMSFRCTLIREPVTSLEEDIAALADMLPHVSSIFLEVNFLPLQLLPVERYVYLRSLCLSDVQLRESAPTVGLPQLEQLSFINVSVDDTIVHQWLRPSVLPRLRVLRLSRPLHWRLDGLHESAADAAHAIVDQLDILQTDSTMLQPDSDLADGSIPPVLMMVVDYGKPFSRHTIFPSRRSLYKPADWPFQALGRLSDQVTGPALERPRVRVVFFPQYFRMLAANHSMLADRMASTTALCSQKSVRVIWYNVADPWSEANVVPPEFWAYARELKATKGRA